jgi:hypothetical protein
MRNIPEERKSHLHRNGSLKSRVPVYASERVAQFSLSLVTNTQTAQKNNFPLILLTTKQS